MADNEKYNLSSWPTTDIRPFTPVSGTITRTSVLRRGSGAGKEDSPASMLLIQGDADETMELVRAHENDGVASCAVGITTCERSGNLNECEKGVQHCSVEQVVDIPLSMVQEETMHFSVVVQETPNQKYFIEECVEIPGKQEVTQSVQVSAVQMVDGGLYNHVKAVVTSFSACEVEDDAITLTQQLAHVRLMLSPSMQQSMLRNDTVDLVSLKDAMLIRIQVVI